MLYTCDKCGKTRADQIIDGERSLAICPECGYARPFRRMPLFAVGGACGTGKTAICKKIAGRVEGLVALDGDGLWEGKGYAAEDPGKFYEDALRIAMNISQSGPAVAVFHAGFGLPDNLEKTVARRYFSKIYYLGLICSDEEQERRLRARPSVQGDGADGFIAAMKGCNAMYRFYGGPGNGYPVMEKLDTTGAALEETAAQVKAWIESKL